MTNKQVMEIIEPGPLSLMTDSGRRGVHHLGLTSGGPMDPESFYWANRLCANPASSTCIEVSIGGFKVKISQDCYLAITGANVPAKVNGIGVPLWQTLRVSTNDILEIGIADAGMRAYIAIAGGFDVAPQFGSCTTVPREKLGGINQDGSGLKGGEHLFSRELKAIELCRLADSLIPDFSERMALRVVLGYQHEAFSALSKARFFNAEYQVSDKMDRMGIRLKGKSVTSSVSSLLSEGIAMGAIQLPPDGQPIVMMNDRQTIGGYPKIGSVFSQDCGKLGQSRPGTRIRFEALDYYTAHNLLHMARIKREQTELIGL